MPTEDLLLNNEAKKHTLETIQPVKASGQSISEPMASTEDSLFNIIKAQQQLSQVKESLGSIIDTLAQDPSMITRVSTFYGEMPQWKKISLGIGLSIPTLLAGLLTISGATVVSYTAASIILEDHYYCNNNVAERLKAGIFSMTDVLQFTIDALETIRQKLTIEIEKFKAENCKLAQNVTNLTHQVGQLSNQVTAYAQTEKMLNQTKTSLEQTVSKLNFLVCEKTDSLNHQQEQVEQIRKEYEVSQTQLAEKTVELTIVQVAMRSEIEKAKKVTEALNGTVATLSGMVMVDATQRESFQAKLNKFLDSKEANLTDVVGRIDNTERELETTKLELKLVKEELDKSLEMHKLLVGRGADHIQRLEDLYKKNAINRAGETQGLGPALSKHGIHAVKKNVLLEENSKPQLVVL